MRKKSLILITLICFTTLIFTNAVFANTLDALKSDNLEVKTLIKKVKNGSSTPQEVNDLFEKVKQGDAEAKKWFEDLAVNDPQKVKKALEGVEVKNNDDINIDFGDGSSIEISLETLPTKEMGKIRNQVSADYMFDITSSCTYKYKSGGIIFGYYHIYCRYGFNDLGASATIIDKWDEGDQLYPVEVITRGVTTLKDKSNPVQVKGLAEIRAFSSTVENIKGQFTCYTKDWMTKNSCKWS